MARPRNARLDVVVPRLACACATVIAIAGLLAGCPSAFAPDDPPDGGATPLADDAGASDAAAAPLDALVPPADAASSDAGTDGDAEPPCMAPKVPVDGGCETRTDCCTNACASNHRCAVTCGVTNDACALGASSCCLGLYCSAAVFGKCAACRPTGADAEKLLSTPLASSCCSGRLDSMGKCAL